MDKVLQYSASERYRIQNLIKLFTTYFAFFSGYGGIAPATAFGKVGSIFYSIIGIPLCMALLAGIGGRLHTHLQVCGFIISLLKCTQYSTTLVVNYHDTNSETLCQLNQPTYKTSHTHDCI